MISLLKVATPRLTATQEVADKVVAEGELDATHAQARRMVEAGDVPHVREDGGIAVTVVAADRQTNALVRFGRPWVSLPGGSFTMSFIAVIPRAVAEDEMVNGWLPMIAGLASLDALEGAIDACGARATDPDCGFKLKWPNDIYCHGLKLGGTFTESMPLPDDDERMAVIFSLGINLAIPADRLPTPKATSLSMHVAPLPSTDILRDMIAARLVASLRARLEAFVDMPLVQSGRLHSEMRHVCWMMGRRIEAQLSDGTSVTGEVVALNDDASISVRMPSGEVRPLLASEVGVLV
ncbi:biotin--[acetyl-CoA-carboxylase] ligase [Bifidobacterium samirii]|uniref:Biotin--[acetyl-CoA-carboxylase] ligase n=1 Tax=Bifidobacterium samirii TaxID=2306974 RepID=A0A430FQZ9_9BIFI|nr:biotin--acetyl-CoA-carboxylase ligase [Bifidobacterium samirii]RSX55248.1 biotin--[acetyl-CoA-carboxylase] ligase [Bifidobacterium samirii]